MGESNNQSFTVFSKFGIAMNAMAVSTHHPESITPARP